MRYSNGDRVQATRDYRVKTGEWVNADMIKPLCDDLFKDWLDALSEQYVMREPYYMAMGGSDKPNIIQFVASVEILGELFPEPKGVKEWATEFPDDELVPKER